jgi:hypothetical protein
MWHHNGMNYFALMKTAVIVCSAYEFYVVAFHKHV